MNLRNSVRLFVVIFLLAAGLPSLRADASDSKKQGGGFWSAFQGADKTASTFALGDRLFHEACTSHSNSERILKLCESLGYLLCAATNHNPHACARLAEAYEKGIGVQTNSASAYAWMKLAVQFDASFAKELDRLVVALEPKDILQGQNLARDYSLGNWPAHIAQPVLQGDPRLNLQGLNMTKGGWMVIVNGSTFAIHDSSDVRVKGPPAAKLTLTCVDIGADYALFSVQGETAQRLLSTTQLTR